MSEREKRKFLIVSQDVRLNNRIIEELEQETDGNLEFKEVSFIEDINRVIFEFIPEKIFINDEVETEVGYSKLQKDIYFYDYIINELKGMDVVLLTDKSIKDRLNAKLIETGFYSICPVSKLEEYLLKPPRSLEELNEAFTEQFYLSNIHKENLNLDKRTTVVSGDDSFKAPPTKLAKPPQANPIQVNPLIDFRYEGNDKPSYEVERATNEVEMEQSAYDRSKVKEALRMHTESNRPIVSVYWSPIPNVGVRSVMKATALSLARKGRKVLMIELDIMYPKLARSTFLSHKDRNIIKAVQALLNDEFLIEDHIVNNQMALDNLPYKIASQAKPALRQLPNNLYVLSRNADIEFIFEPEITDNRIIEKLFFQARQAGFNNILVNVPSNPSHLFTTLALLGADERFLVVDDSDSTAVLFQNALDALKIIKIEENDFELIINKVSERVTASDIAERYRCNPILSLPFCEELIVNQRALFIEGGPDYMNAIHDFIVTRYGVEESDDFKKKKKLFNLFGA